MGERKKIAGGLNPQQTSKPANQQISKSINHQSVFHQQIQHLTVKLVPIPFFIINIGPP